MNKKEVEETERPPSETAETATKQPFSINSLKEFLFRHYLIILIILAVIIFVTAGLIIFLKKSDNDSGRSTETNNSAEEETPAMKDGKALSSGMCEGEEKPKITNLPMNYDDFSFIIPYGLTAGGHVTPIDHQYFSPTIFNSPRDKYEVFAMADAKLVGLEERNTDRGVEYRLVFSQSCKLFYYYDLVTSLSPEIKAAYDNRQNSPVNMSVKAGQTIGRIGGQTLDFAVWDMDERLTGFVVPERYDGEVWKIHTVDPLNYYTEDLKAKAISKYIRTTEPISGKIDYDIDGKLVGNWFLEGSGGYIPPNLEGGKDYWKGHLSIAYDMYDPASIVFSTGDYDGEAKQFGVKSNQPDPATVDLSSGLVKYELVQQDWADPAAGNWSWDRTSFVKGLKAKNYEGYVTGTALVQMLENRKIKVEVFPGKRASQIPAFTPAARIYER